MPDTFAKIRLQQLGLIGIIVVVFLSMSFLPVVMAQEDGPRVLTPGASVAGVLNADSAAQIYTFVGEAGATVELTAVSAAGSPLVILLSDARGNPIAQVVDSSTSGAVTLSTTLAETGTYYITVFAASGASAIDTFTLSLNVSGEAGSGDIATPEPTDEVVTPEPTDEGSEAASTPVDSSVTVFGSGQQREVLLPGGIQVVLSWDAPVDLNLQVRDPSGETLYWDSRATSIGGSFGFDANGLCETLVDAPSETATWPSGFLPTGSYEILVYYRQACETANPATFTVDVVVNGVALPQIAGTVLPPLPNQDSVYIARFVVDDQGNAAIDQGSVYSGINSLPAAAQQILDSAIPITRGTPVQGVLTNAQVYQSYSFAGLANELITVDMQATDNGDLDTLLLLIDSNGNLVASNDDANNTTNSLISNWRLLADDTYTIIATRYGKEIGGTEGGYEIILSGPTSDLPPAVANLDLPDGDIEVSLVWDTNADLQLLVRDPVGDSVFDDQTFVNSGGVLAANGNVGCVPAETGQPVSYIYWPRGFLRPGSYEVEVWYQSDCDDATPVEFTVTAVVNDEVVFAERQRPLPGQRYVFSFEVDPAGEATAGLGGFVGGSETLNYQAEIDSATPIVSGQPVSGTLSSQNTFDVYSFEGNAGDVVTVSMSASTGTLDTKLFLISPSGIEVAENDDAVPGETTDALLSDIELTETGQYVIIATRFAMTYGGTIGGYNLNFRQN